MARSAVEIRSFPVKELGNTGHLLLVPEAGEAVAIDPPRDVGAMVAVERDELEARARFSERYSAAMPPVRRLIERRVIGGDWGANGYTTMAEADVLARHLRISTADSLLAAPEYTRSRWRRRHCTRTRPRDAATWSASRT